MLGKQDALYPHPPGLVPAGLTLLIMSRPSLRLQAFWGSLSASVALLLPDPAAHPV